MTVYYVRREYLIPVADMHHVAPAVRAEMVRVTRGQDEMEAVRERLTGINESLVTLAELGEEVRDRMAQISRRMAGRKSRPTGRGKEMAGLTTKGAKHAKKERRKT